MVEFKFNLLLNLCDYKRSCIWSTWPSDLIFFYKETK